MNTQGYSGADLVKSINSARCHMHKKITFILWYSIAHLPECVCSLEFNRGRDLVAGVLCLENNCNH